MKKIIIGTLMIIGGTACGCGAASTYSFDLKCMLFTWAWAALTFPGILVAGVGAWDKIWGTEEEEA